MDIGRTIKKLDREIKQHEKRATKLKKQGRYQDAETSLVVARKLRSQRDGLSQNLG